MQDGQEVVQAPQAIDGLKYNGQKQKLFVDGDTDKYTVEKTGYSNYTKPFEDGVTEGKYANGSYAAMFVLKDKEHYVWSDNGKSDDKKTTVRMICTPKVRHFWRCIFLWQRKGKNIENTRQNSNYLL